MKKLLSIIIVLALTFALLPAAALAEFDPDSIPTPHIVLMDAETGAVLYEKSSTEQAFPASTTKIMTAILAIENSDDLNTVVTIGDSVETKGSVMKILPGEEIPLIDLIYGMMLVSGNDAAEAIAIHIAGSEEAFAQLMNQKAMELGMKDTHFVKPNGLHKDDHFTTAYDMALLTRYAMKNQTFRTVVNTEIYNVAPTNRDSDGYILENTNKLLHTKADDAESYKYPYATGVKTGDTDQAGRCLVASAYKDGVELIAVLFGDPQGDSSRNIRFTNAAALFEWGFEKRSTVSAAELGLESTAVLPVSNAGFEDAENGNLTLNIDLTDKYICGLAQDLADITENAAQIITEYSMGSTLSAPISEGDVVGQIEYIYNGAVLFTADLIASRSVAEIGAVNEPSPSPLTVTPNDDEKSGGSSLLFWILVAVAIFAIILVIQLIASRRKRRRNSRRRRSAYRAYKR